MHEAAAVGRADVHAGALAHRLEALEDQQVPRGVGAVLVGGLRGPALRTPLRTSSP